MRYALAAGLAAVVLAGCSSALPPAPLANATPQRHPTPAVSPTTTVPMTPQQRYIDDMNGHYPDFAANLPDPNFGATGNSETGTDAAILDFGAQACEALATGGTNAATYDTSEEWPPGDGSNTENSAIVSLTQSVLCPVPSSYQSVYQDYVNALKAAGVYKIVASSDSNGDPVQFANIDICISSVGIWTSDLSANVTQAQANEIAKLTDEFLCPKENSQVIVPTVTYIASGDSILYGPAGSSNQGSSGMHLTEEIPSSLPAYFAISVTAGSCRLVILNSDGSTSTSQASAPSGLANCELVDIGGVWYDANTG
ncbi:MAG: hypothetical protein ACLPN6_07845 [Streptosporangiaceae bacterium]